VYVDEGEDLPHKGLPGPSNNGSIRFRNLITGTSATLLEETDTSYEIIRLDEISNRLYFKATKYSFSEKCPREEGGQYCSQTSTTDRSIALP
jgi:hypothetical protein